MAITNATTSTSITENILAETINAVVLEENQAPTIMEALAWIIDLSTSNSATHNVNRESAATVSTQAAETDALTVSEYTLDEQSITAGTKYVRRNPAFQATQDATMALLERITRNNVRACRDQKDTDGCSTFTSATSSVGTNADTFDLTKWGSATYTFLALDPGPGPYAFVAHNIHIRDLTNSARATTGAIFGSDAYGSMAAQLLKQQGVGGFMGDLEDFMVFRTTNVPESGSAKVGAMFTIGEGNSPVALGDWVPINTLTDTIYANLAYDIITWSRYGWSMVNPNKITKVLCKNT